MGGESPRVVQPQWHSNSCLKAGKNPDLHPTTFQVKIPRKQAARFHNRKDVLTTNHGLVYVLSGFTSMIFGKLVATRAIGLSYHTLWRPSRSRSTLKDETIELSDKPRKTQAQL